MMELVDMPDLGSGGRPCRFKPCYPHQISTIVLIRRYLKLMGGYGITLYDEVHVHE